MLKLLELIFGESVYIPWSWLVTQLLRRKGVRVGKDLNVQGVPTFKIRGKAANIIIGNNVRLIGNVDLRNRGEGKIILEDNTYLDKDCRLVAANNALIHIKKNAEIGLNCVMNAGTDIIVGEGAMIAGFCYLQSSNHGLKKDQTIKEQPHTYGKITIKDDVWLGGQVTVLAGVEIGQGAVIGAKSVVTRDVPDYEIWAGVPAKKISERI